MLDRTSAPSFGKIESINLLEPSVHHLDNGIPVFAINAGAQEVLKVELVFEAGTATTDKMLVSSVTSHLLTSGTKAHSALEIAQAVDFYGAHLETEISQDQCSLCLYTLNKHLDKTANWLSEVYESPIFPEREVETYILKSKQEMLVNLEKVSYLGAKGFSAALFGETHPYGRSASISDYESFQREEILKFHETMIKDRILHIIVSGKLTDSTIEILNKRFGQHSRSEILTTEIEIGNTTGITSHIDKTDAVQNSIKIGRVLFNRAHPDFIGLQILTTVLGGYFGSRLMTNIREDKGYTYGIGAGLVSLKHSGYLSISTEVGSDVCQAAINEIYVEIERLRKNLIPTEELELVRNYMLGSILKSADGPFNIASKWKTYLKHGLGASAHYNLVKQIQTITPERLRELAASYLQKEDLVQVTAGKALAN